MKCAHHYLLSFVIGSSSLSQLFTLSAVAMKQNLFKNENKMQVQKITKELLVAAITKVCSEGGLPQNLFNNNVHPYLLALALGGHVKFSYREIVDALQGGLLGEVRKEFQTRGGISNDFQIKKNKENIIENIPQSPPNLFNQIESKGFNMTKDYSIKKDEQENILNQNQANSAPFANDNLIEMGLTKKSIIECVPGPVKIFTCNDKALQDSVIHVEYISKAYHNMDIWVNGKFERVKESIKDTSYVPDLFVNVNNKNSEIFEKGDISFSTRRFPEAVYAHPYNPDNINLPSFVLNLKFPKDVNRWETYVPQFIREYLKNHKLTLDNLDIFGIVQSIDSGTQALKPHGWAFAGKTFDQYKTPYSETLSIDAVTFDSLHPITSDFIGNAAVNLMNAKPKARSEMACGAKNTVESLEDNTITFSIIVHDSTCSPDNMQTTKLSPACDHAFYSLCILPDKKKAALTLHVIPKNAEFQIIKDALYEQYEQAEIKSSVSFKQIHKTICGALLKLKTEDAKLIVNNYLRSWIFKMLLGDEI